MAPSRKLRYSGYSFGARFLHSLDNTGATFPGLCLSFSERWDSLDQNKKDWIKRLAKEYNKSEAYRIEQSYRENGLQMGGASWLTGAIPNLEVFLILYFMIKY